MKIQTNITNNSAFSAFNAPSISRQCYVTFLLQVNNYGEAARKREKDETYKIITYSFHR